MTVRRDGLARHARRIVASILESATTRGTEESPTPPPRGEEPVSPEGPPVRFEPGHYYSPMYDSRELVVEPARSRIWPARPHERPGIDWREDAQRSFMVDVLGAQERLVLREAGDPEDGEYYALNGQFPPLDAWALEGMLRHLRPRRMIEVGSGYSSLIAAQVNREFLDGGMDFVCIEPYPRAFLSAGVAGIGELIVAKVEDVPLERFQALDRGDVLFIDTSHVIRTGNDVAWLYGQVLPRVRPGVHVHIHDVFLPGDYPIEWVREGWGWNENYLVEAFLNFNHAFEIVLGSQWAGHHAVEELARAFPQLATAPDQGGGSLWLRRTRLR
ncbi:MAG TPA: class I SAM-dependent methyltransferase [Acidimicrobiales bacterium]|nr:class I SAM-dependent methyltransferase [Acidimicrobiales bacterium]